MTITINWKEFHHEVILHEGRGKRIYQIIGKELEDGLHHRGREGNTEQEKRSSGGGD